MDINEGVHPCPYFYDNGTEIVLDSDLKICCNERDVTHEIVNLRKNYGTRYDDS